MVLKSRVKVGLGRMSGVAGFGEKGQIGQRELPHYCAAPFNGRKIGVPNHDPVDHQDDQRQRPDS